MITGRTKVCGLMGYPVEHSMSPFIHGRLSEILDEDLAYVAFPVKPGELGDAVRGASALGICGLNVTVPHKESVMEFLSDTDPIARKIGAVNTLVRTDEGSFKGYNTDLIGLDRAITAQGIDPAGRNVMIIGAGGAARAVAVLNAERKAGRIFILNRSIKRAEILSDFVNKTYETDIAVPLSLEDTNALPDDRMIVFQSTSAGLYPNTEQVPTDDEKILSRAETVFDLIYTPLETRFMRLSRERGAKVYNGLWMLVWQAVSAYELWTGRDVSEMDAQVIYSEMHERMMDTEVN